MSTETADSIGPKRYLVEIETIFGSDFQEQVLKKILATMANAYKQTAETNHRKNKVVIRVVEKVEVDELSTKDEVIEVAI